MVAVATTMALTTKQYEKTAEELEEKLNTLGAQGWELIEREDGFFFFKRPVE